jgi:predicted O-methyltransferase YrrM
MKISKITRFFRPTRYSRRIRAFLLKCRYDMAAVAAVERAKFTALGFDYSAARKNLDIVLKEMQKPAYSDSNGIASVHWLLFACLAGNRKVDRILEIGTFDGETAALLARLFPDAEIVTVDLPSTDPILAESYDYARGGAEKLNAFEQRLANNTRAANIKLVRVNSFFLPAAVDGLFDLIWVDGGHLYPEVAWDLCNAYHCLKPGGTLMCDDVIPLSDGLRDAYVSPDSHSVLRYVVDRSGDAISLFLKREAPEWSADPRQRKFVAMLKKRLAAQVPTQR